MSVAEQNWTWEQGADLVMSMIYRTGPQGEETPVDLSDYSLRMDVVYNGTRMFTFNSSDIPGDTSVDQVGPADNEATLGNDGTIRIAVPRSLTLEGGALFDSIVPNSILVLQYDIFLRDGSGLQFKLMKGTISVNPSETLWV